ncbi:MAG: endonuclease Q family protein [Patescibacteria group bacterium]
MRVITDLHIHSRFSRACSKALTIPNLAKRCEQKGIQLVTTGDFTHPAWRKEMGESLEEAEGGAFALRDGSSPTRFILGTEVSCIYKRGGKTRRVHNLLFLPTFAAVDRFTSMLTDRGFNVKSDGRPILGLDSEDLLKMLFESDERAIFIPAHIWTPWFAIFGSQSGFDSMEECFGDSSRYIHALETGLSSDPAMNWRWSALDRYFLVSNSDAHSLDKLGREANVFDMETPTYDELRRILVEHDVSKFLETIEFFPEEGKYHTDGHRDCGFWCEPEETKRMKGMCPKCGKPMTVGVLHRVADLADRPRGGRPPSAVPFRSIIPLDELVADALSVGSASKKVQAKLGELLKNGRTEFGILLDLPESELRLVAGEELARVIMRMRAGDVEIRPGYDGEFGKIHVKDGVKNVQTALL